MDLRRSRIPTSYASEPSELLTRDRNSSAVEASENPFLKGYQEAAWRWLEDWKEILQGDSLFSDLLAGITVAAVALPLNVALAIAAGLPASAGLWAGAAGGLVAAVFGGSKLQATGSAAALNVMVTGLVTQYGPQGAFAGALLVGALQVLLSFTLLGRFAKYLPEVVLTGFTTGVGLKLLNQQLPEVLDIDHSVVHLLRSLHDPAWLREVSWTAVICGLGTVYAMIVGKPWKRFPAALVGLSVATFISEYLKWDLHRVGAIPPNWPDITLPSLPQEQWFELFLKVLPLALLASVESLISARAVDGMVPDIKPHHSDLEVFGQGMGNIAAGLVGAPPVSGVIVRSSVNAQSGARTRLAGILHGVVLMASTFFIGRELAMVPVAALAGLLCVIGFRLVSIGEFWHLLKTHRVGALAFLISMAGVLSDHLMLGLVTALLVHALDHWRTRKSRAQESNRQQNLKKGIRGKIEAHDARKILSSSAAFKHEVPLPEENWELHVSQRPQVHPTAFIHPNASVIGRVVISEQVHVAAETSLRADEGTPFFLGAEVNIQDGVVLHALKGKWVTVGSDKWAIYIGRQVSVAHQALIHGPCFIGNRCFIGFKAVVHDTILGEGCFVGIGSTVVGVDVPPGRYIPHGSVIDSPEKVAALPPVQEHHQHFNEDVVEVNTGLIEAYRLQDESQEDPADLRPSPTQNTSSQKYRWETL